MSGRVVVEVHRHRGWSPDQAVGLITTPTSVVVVDNVNGACELTVLFKAPVGEFHRVVKPGDYIVVRSMAGYAEAWGYVHAVSAEYSAAGDGRVSTNAIRVQCHSWFDLLSLVKLYSPPGETTSTGTVMSLEDWAGLNASITEEYVTGSVGVALQRIHQRIAKVRLPESLGGEYIGDAIPVVHNEETRRTYAPDRVIDEVAVAGGLPTQLSYSFHESTVREIYTGAFVPDSRLIELFPSLEDVGSSTGDPTLSALTRALGRRPVLIYRLRPFRSRPLLESVMAREDFTLDPDSIWAKLSARSSWGVLQNQGIGLTGSPKHAASTVGQTYTSAQLQAIASLSFKSAQEAQLYDIFTKVTWDTTRAIDIPQSTVRRVTFSWDDTRRVNCVSVRLSTSPGLGIEAASVLGLPMKQSKSIVEYGARVAKPTWPFVVTKPGTNDWVAYMRSIAAQLMQFEQNAHLMSDGIIVTDYDRATRISEDPTRSQTTFGPIRYIPVGEIVSLKHEGSLPFYAYSQMVVREYQTTSKGAEKAVTTVHYTRGLYGIEELRDTPVPLTSAGTIAKRVTRAALASGGSGGTRPDPAVVACTEGVAWTAAWPKLMTDIDLDAIPAAQLMAWAQNRGFVAADFSTAGSEHYYRALVTAGVARITEMYWRQVHPNARVHALSVSVGRVDGPNHSTGASFDHAVILSGTGEPYSVLQTWGALLAITRAKRIPVGTKGLYLNVSGSGLRGSTPELAGAASGSASNPKGSSAGIHYDYRGTFGFTARYGPSNYVDLDTDGDGSDEDALSGSIGNGAAAMRWLNANLPSVGQYVTQAGKDDPTLPPVGPTVPNLMQVLGQQQFCGLTGGFV